jgi:ribosomal protein L40E
MESGVLEMGACVTCGGKAGFLATECGSCMNTRLQMQSQEAQSLREERETARQHRISEELNRILADVKLGFKCYLHKTEYINVDSELSGDSFNFGEYDDSNVRLSGLEGWKVVGMVPRTFGTLLQNTSGMNSVWAGGTGGNVSGAYVLMELELTPSNVDTLTEEIEEYLQETVR